MSLELAVIIATRNRPDALADAVADVLAQLPAGAVLIVVDQSDPPTAATNAERLPDRVQHRISPARSLPAGRNEGVEASTAAVLLFLDDDVRLFDGCIEAHLTAYTDPAVGGVVGRIEERVVRPNVPHTANRLDAGGRLKTNLEGHERCRIDTLKGCNMSFRRSALDDAGPFDPGFAGTAFLEDADLSTRVAAAGWQLWFEPAAALRHLSTPSGGVRVGSSDATERWRFHNTGRFVRKHRGWRGGLPMAVTFAAIAGRRAWQWRDPGAFPTLMRALLRGWHSVHSSAPA